MKIKDKKRVAFALDKIQTAVEQLKNCGSGSPGSPGFQPGNSCAGGGGGTRLSAADLSKRMAFKGKISKPKEALMRAEFERSVGVVLDNLGPEGHKILAENLNKIHTYGNPKSLVDDVRKYGVRGRALGYYNRATKDVGIVASENPGFGKSKIGKGKWRVGEEVLSHELAHALDGPRHSISSSKEWQSVFNAEMKSNSYFNATSKSSSSEAFASMTREFLVPRETLWNDTTMKMEPTSPPSEKFPKAYEFFRGRGLL